MCIPNLQEVKLFSYRMPGHIKKSTGPDPDPSPWLKVSDEFRDRNKSKPYDAKKSCWVPNANKVLDIPDLAKHSLCLLFSSPPFVQAEGGYLEGLCENEMKVLK